MVMLFEAHLLIFSVSGRKFSQKAILFFYFFPTGFFSGRCRKVHIDFRRIPIKDIPIDSDGQKEWICNAFKRKDRSVRMY